MSRKAAGLGTTKRKQWFSLYSLPTHFGLILGAANPMPWRHGAFNSKFSLISIVAIEIMLPNICIMSFISCILDQMLLSW